VAHLNTQRALHLEHLMSALGSPRYLQLIERLFEGARTPQLVNGERRARKILPPLVRASWKRIPRRVARLGPDPAPADVHAVRIRAKRLRYAAELVVPLVGKPARRLARAAREVQQTLGQHQDAIVATAWLREAAPHVSREAAFAAGALASGEEIAGVEILAAWPRAWKRLRKAAKADLRR